MCAQGQEETERDAWPRPHLARDGLVHQQHRKHRVRRGRRLGAPAQGGRRAGEPRERVQDAGLGGRDGEEGGLAEDDGVLAGGWMDGWVGGRVVGEDCSGTGVGRIRLCRHQPATRGRGRQPRGPAGAPRPRARARAAAAGRPAPTPAARPRLRSSTAAALRLSRRTAPDQIRRPAPSAAPSCRPPPPALRGRPAVGQSGRRWPTRWRTAAPPARGTP
jgi:hypothetical protein